MKLKVMNSSAGWIVVGGVTMGPFSIKSRAIDLAEGMVDALRRSGETVELDIEPDAPRWAAHKNVRHEAQPQA